MKIKLDWLRPAVESPIPALAGVATALTAGPVAVLAVMGYGLIENSYSEALEMLARVIKPIVLASFLLGVAGFIIGCVDEHRDTVRIAQAKEDAIARERALSPRTRVLAGKGDRYALEIRGVGISIEDAWQDELWREIVRPKNSYSSFLPHRAEGYASTSHDRIRDYTLAQESCAESVSIDAVSDWPVPLFAAQPASHPSMETSAGGASRRVFKDASLVYSYGIWVDEVNDEDASSLVDSLFAFFDAHPEVPEAILMVKDGDIARQLMGPVGGGTLREGAYVPDKPLSVVTLLVSRTDRVDRYIRPYAMIDKDPATSAQQVEYDYIKQYNFYSKESKAYGPSIGLRGRTTLPAAYWEQRVPRLIERLDDKGVAGFKRTNYLPLRWTDWQVRHFDKAPVMGYLHRPVTVRLRDEHGRLLSSEAQTAALSAGWQRALGTLPMDTPTTRFFHDTRRAKALATALAPILKAQPHPLDILNVDQAIDIGLRIGDTGVSSPFVQIALGTMASYKLGGASATIHQRDNGDVTFTMVSPPDEETKAKWEGPAKRNPFYAHVPQ